MLCNCRLDKKYFFPKVLQVVPTDNFEIYAYFNDGSVHYMDIKPLIKTNTVFEILKDILIFKSKITVLNDTVAWDLNGDRDTCACIDLDPIVIFDTPNVNDPLEKP